MKSLVFALFLAPLAGISQLVTPDKIDKILVQPIYHGSLALQYDSICILVDPYGGIKRYNSLKSPDIILITDIHRDHYDIKTLRELSIDSTTVVVPKAVYTIMPEFLKNKAMILENNQDTVVHDIQIKAIPMYNLPEDAPNLRHPKGRGNGYTLKMGDKTVYISGDTEDVPEMRRLQNIDIAFVCMNLPFTMDIHHAADAVLEFKPDIIYPYHYRGKREKSDLKAFKTLITNNNDNIQVRLRDWYKP